MNVFSSIYNNIDKIATLKFWSFSEFEELEIIFKKMRYTILKKYN